MANFFCGRCQKCVEPKTLYYSCPMQGDCPNCGDRLEDTDGGIKVLEVKEAFEARPEMYINWKEEDPEGFGKMPKKIKEEFEEWLKEKNGPLKSEE